MPCRKKKDARPYRPKETDFLHWSCVSAGLLYDGGSHRFSYGKKDEVKEVSAVVTEEPKVNTGYAAMETNPLLENRDEELADAVEAYYQELSGKEAYAEAYRWDCDLHERRQSKRQQDPVCTVQYEDPWNLH